MPDQTNITDTHVPAAGHTTTTLVSTHDRGTQDWAARQGGGQANVPATPGAGTPPASPPTLASISPNTAVAGSAALTVTATGTNFDNAATINVNGLPVATSWISTTSMTTSYTPLAAAGSAGFTVENPDGQESGSLAFTTT